MQTRVNKILISFFNTLIFFIANPDNYFCGLFFLKHLELAFILVHVHITKGVMGSKYKLEGIPKMEEVKQSNYCYDSG